MPQDKKSEEYRKKIREFREIEKARQIEQERQAQTNLATSQNRFIELEDEGSKGFNLLDFYAEWSKKYKSENPEFDEDENRPSSKNALTFADPKAEEAFVRALAKRLPGGEIVDKGIVIAKFQNGELVDPRTNRAFPDGGYANLVAQLDAGVKYDEIPSPKAPTPFSTDSTPY